MRAIFRHLLLTSLAGMALCQEFEVISIKPNRSGSNSTDVDNSHSRLIATNLSLKSMIAMGSGLKDYQVDGPDWLNSERFDVAAKFPEAMPKDREEYNEAMRSMMEKMLTDRFKLVSHRGMKTFSVYGLTVGKSGAKFQEATVCEGHSSNSNNTHYTGKCVTMEVFAAFLSRRRVELPADLPVLDMTGLKGFYNVTLDWVRESKDDAQPAGSLLPEALQEQLGLKLETRKAPIEILIVDHAERQPTAN